MPKWGHLLGGAEGKDKILGVVVNQHDDGAVDAYLFPGWNAAYFGMSEGSVNYRDHIPANQWESAAEAAQAAKK